jgi:ribosomal RNA-processing protein 17
MLSFLGKSTVKFNFSSRLDYIKGFSKRKTQRKQEAKEKIALEEKQQRAEEKRQRKEKIEEDYRSMVAAVNDADSLHPKKETETTKKPKPSSITRKFGKNVTVEVITDFDNI